MTDIFDEHAFSMHYVNLHAIHFESACPDTEIRVQTISKFAQIPTFTRSISA